LPERRDFDFLNNIGALHIDGEQIPIKRIRSIDKLKENLSQRRPRKKIPQLYTNEVSALRDNLFVFFGGYW
jgi:hypothetical protein